MRKLIHTAAAHGQCAIGPTPEAALRELSKLTPIHDAAVTHGELVLTDEPPALEIFRR